MKKMSKAELAQLMAMSQQASMGSSGEPEAAFEKLGASEIYCPNCKKAMPVREKMLLTLPGGDLYDFVCTACGESLGTRR